MGNQWEEKKTAELDAILQSAKPENFAQFEKEELGNNLPKLSDYLNSYIGIHGLVLSEVIRASLLSPDYAYAIFNGNKTRPTRDRVIALCLAMHMDLVEAQRALKLCNAGVLYSKSRRDALLMICFNTGLFDVMEVNALLSEHNLQILETSKEARETSTF